MEILAVRSVVELVLTDNFKVLCPFVPEVVFSLHQSAPEVTEATHLAAALKLTDKSLSWLISRDFPSVQL